MNTLFRRLCRFSTTLAVLLFGAIGIAAAQSTAFSYQGRLTDGGNPANASYDLQFKLFDTGTPGTGTQQGTTQAVSPVAASAGVFTVTLDFGQTVFGGTNRFLEIGVRPAGSAAAYTILAPRQSITSAPYAIQTLNAQALGGLPANRYVASAANGNVGLGTASPAHRLDINGGPTWTANGWKGALALSNVSAIGWYPDAAGKAYGIGQTDGGLFIFNTQDAPGNTASPANYLMTIADSGNVGIGMVNAASKLEIAAQDGLRISGYQPFLTLNDTNTGRFAYLQSAGGAAFLTTNSKAFLTLQDITGSVGVGVASPVHRVDINGGPAWTSSGWAGAVAMNNAAALGWRPNAAGRSFGIGQANGGLSIFSTTSAPGNVASAASPLLQISDFGHVVQPLAYYGLPKAMLSVYRDGSIRGCYNGVTGSATAGCGFSITRINDGIYRINLGFNVTGRFVNATPIYSGNGQFDPLFYNQGANFRQFSANEMEVFTFLTDGKNNTVDVDFHFVMH